MTTQAKSSIAALALVAAAGLGASSAAHAGGDVFWSIAMSQPGVHVGVSNAPPVPILVHESRPIYMPPPPPPVYVPQPRVVYLPPPPPVYRATYYGYGYGPGYGHGWGHDRGRRGWEERHERHEHRGGYEGRGDRGGYGRHEGGGHGGGRAPEMNIGRR